MISWERKRQGEREGEEQKGKEKRTAACKFINWDCFHICSCLKAWLLGVRSARFIGVFASLTKEQWAWISQVCENCSHQFLGWWTAAQEGSGSPKRVSNYPELVQDLHYFARMEESTYPKLSPHFLIHKTWMIIIIIMHVAKGCRLWSPWHVIDHGDKWNLVFAGSYS